MVNLIDEVLNANAEADDDVLLDDASHHDPFAYDGLEDI